MSVNKLKNKFSYALFTVFSAWAIFSGIAHAESVKNNTVNQSYQFLGFIDIDIAIGITLLAAAAALVVSLYMFAFACVTQSEFKNFKTADIKKIKDEVRRLDKENELLKKDLEKIRNNSCGSLFINGKVEEKFMPRDYNRNVFFDKKQVASELEDDSQQKQKKQNADDNQFMQRKRLYEEKSRKFTEEYNKLANKNLTGLEWKNQKNLFIDKFAVRSFYCENYEERLNDNSLEPVFKDNKTGKANYWAVQVDKDCYIVVPRLKMDYEIQTHEIGGMKEVFESNYQSGMYKYIVIKEPAVFSFADGTWSLQKSGKIELGR